MHEEQSHEAYEEAVGPLRSASNLVVITGAGVSAESGVHTFRGKGGLWDQYDMNEVATATALRRDPENVWRFVLLLREELKRARPNPGHAAIADLENHIPVVRVITQNIDALHQMGGSTEVLEIHGDLRTARNEATGKTYPIDDLDLSTLPPPCPETGGRLRPNVLYFEEAYDPGILATASAWVREADVILVVGTSGMVPTPYVLAQEGKVAGAWIIDVNLKKTTPTGWFGFAPELADVFLQGKSGQVLPELVAELRKS